MSACPWPNDYLILRTGHKGMREKDLTEHISSVKVWANPLLLVGFLLLPLKWDTNPAPDVQTNTHTHPSQGYEDKEVKAKNLKAKKHPRVDFFVYCLPPAKFCTQQYPYQTEECAQA